MTWALKGDGSTLQAKGTVMHIKTVKQVACAGHGNRSGLLEYSTYQWLALSNLQMIQSFKFTVRWREGAYVL